MLQWYGDFRRDLPWRRDPTPYAVWISEVMLQQTRVETVIPYFERFLARFPSVEKLAGAPLDSVLALWSGLGYYRRARALHEGARVIVERHGGAFPRDLSSALSLPGVGPYTAGAVLSIAYNVSVPVVDGNVERVLSRVLRLRGNPKSSSIARRIRRLLSSWIPAGRASDFNQALMELGATVCTPSSPACGRCPLRTACGGASRGDALSFPASPAARPSLSIAMAAGALRRGDRYLLERQPAGSLLEGLWLFPWVESGAAPSGQRDRAESEGAPPVLVERLGDALGVRLRVATLVAQLTHSITFRRIRIRVFRLEAERPELLERASPPRSRYRWAPLSRLGTSVPVSSLALKIARRL